MDIALIYNEIQGQLGLIDIALNGSDLLTGDELRTAIILSLFTNRRAADDDVLPIGATDRQGCWIDQFSEKEGDQIGSRFWLLKQGKQTQETLNKYNEYAQEALQWFIDDGIANEVIVDVQFIRLYAVGVNVILGHPDGTNSRYEFLWDQVRNSSAASEPVAVASPLPFLTTETGAILVTESGLMIAVG